MSSGSTTSDQCVLFCNPCWSRSIDLRALELRTAGMASAALFPTVLWRRVCVLEKQRPPPSELSHLSLHMVGSLRRDISASGGLSALC